ncbi:MAG: DUF1492 domain-containing protein [Gordonibacter sp.]
MRMKLSREQKIVDRFLRTYDMVESRLGTNLAGLERAESARSSITGSIEAMSLSGGQRDKLAESLVTIDAAVDEISACADLFAANFREIEGFVSEVQRIDCQAGKVLRYVYLEQMTASDVAERVGYSRRNVYTLLKRGLDIAFDLLLKEGMNDRE